ncbi:hypothetical protein DH2020_023095 [Rehmannia glutinosa]|uniref:Uncharacterized protein n=1 Tax=Rehmannia glutinosa TaxID=99300 RepID=A0ABR0W5X6_REHGL
MPKNKGKGGKNRKRGKNEADDEKRELVFKEDGQEYAQVLRMLETADARPCVSMALSVCAISEARCTRSVVYGFGVPFLVHRFVHTLSAWNCDYSDDKADVILKYMPDEARLLKAYGELPENTRLNEGIAGGLDEEDDGPGDDYIEFEDEDIDKL